MSQEHNLNKANDGLSALGSARRRLVRGTFAAPAVLTVHSGSALATTSLGSCLRKANLAPVTQPVTDSASTDVYFRYKLWAFVRIANPTLTYPLGSVRTADGYWIKGAELAVYVRSGQTPFLGSSSWQKFDLTTNALTTTVQTTTPTTGSATPSNWQLQQVSKFVSLRVSGTGALTGAGASGSGSAVSNSCWNSFAAGSGA